jgi:hypothetical protein
LGEKGKVSKIFSAPLDTLSKRWYLKIATGFEELWTGGLEKELPPAREGVRNPREGMAV